MCAFTFPFRYKLETKEPMKVPISSIYQKIKEQIESKQCIFARLVYTLKITGG